MHPPHLSNYRSLTEEEQRLLKEFAVHEARGYRNPIYFAEFHLGLCLHEGQKRWLLQTDPVANPSNSRKNILSPANRWGKTVGLAIKHIRFNYYKIGLRGNTCYKKNFRYFTLDLSPHSAQIKACFNYILDILNSNFPTFQRDGEGHPKLTEPITINKCRIGDFYESHNSTQHEIRFKNKSCFCGSSSGGDQGESLQGRTFGYISYDECVLSGHLQDELYGRIFSRTFDLNAPIDLVTTPDVKGKSQQFLYHLARGAIKKENDWNFFAGSMDENIFIPKEVVEASKERMRTENPHLYRQVVFGDFIASGGRAFDTKAIEQIWDRNIPAPSKGRFQNPCPGNNYLISVDWGFADSGDPSIMLIIDYTSEPFTIVHHEVMRGASPAHAFSTLRVLKQHFNDAKVIMDTNSMGGILIKKMLDEMGMKTIDFNAHGGEKGEAVLQTQLALQKGRKTRWEKEELVEENPNFGLIRSYYIKELEEQLSIYEVEDKTLQQDFVVALYQAIWYLLKKKNDKPRVFQISLGNIRLYEPHRQTISNFAK